MVKKTIKPQSVQKNDNKFFQYAIIAALNQKKKNFENFQKE